MGKHRLKIKDVCDKTGLARNTVAFLYHEKVKRVDFETLAKLCELFDCDVVDILEVER
jgi:putative transcriptional regulator